MPVEKITLQISIGTYVAAMAALEMVTRRMAKDSKGQKSALVAARELREAYLYKEV